jgi:hypothetical protein
MRYHSPLNFNGLFNGPETDGSRKLRNEGLRRTVWGGHITRMGK